MALGVLSQEAASELDKYLMSDECGYTLEQLMEVAGLGVAQCTADFVEGQNLGKKVLLLCGPGNNGGDGLVAARYLILFGYQVSIAYPKQGRLPFYKRLLTLLDQSGVNPSREIPTCEEMDQCDLIIDALFGFGFSGEMREPFLTLVQRLCKTSTPIVSVDVPSGWNVDEGPRSDAYAISPVALISLTMPKKCSECFVGCHYLAGRFVPKEASRKFHLSIPPDVYSGSRMFCKLSGDPHCAV